MANIRVLIADDSSLARGLLRCLLEAEPGIEVVGDELAIGLQGEVEFHIGGDQFVLRAGDSLHFKSSLPHSWRNAGGRTARMIVVGSMPRSFQSAEIENRIASARRRAS